VGLGGNVMQERSLKLPFLASVLMRLSFPFIHFACMGSKAVFVLKLTSSCTLIIKVFFFTCISCCDFFFKFTCLKIVSFLPFLFFLQYHRTEVSSRHYFVIVSVTVWKPGVSLPWKDSHHEDDAILS